MEFELAWAAGFFDGEGSTGVLKAQRDRYAYLRMSIAQKFPECLERFKNAVDCGTIYKSNTREIYNWNCYKKEDVEHVIAILSPYLSVHKINQIVKAREVVAQYKV